MEDERWTTKDKIEQFRGVTGLYQSTAANIRDKTSALRKKQNKDIKNLNKQNKRYNQQYEEMLQGDKANLLPALHTHPKLQLAYTHLNPQQIEEELKQAIFCKNKELDRLRYKKKTLEDVYLGKKLELAELQKEVEEAPENFLWEQELANQIQSVSVKLSTARANKEVHEKAVNILQKDAIRFDQVLGSLRQDLEHQCESIIKAEEMGQNVAEELGKLQREYRQTEKEVRSNMKQRDREIRSLRADIDNLRAHGYATVSRESRSVQAANLEDEDSGEGDVQAMLDMHIKREIELSESMLNKVKEACKVHRVQDIIPRLEEQKRRREWLDKQVSQNQEQLERMLELHNQLEVMLEVVMYQSMTEEAVQLQEERKKLRADIEAEMESLKDTQQELTVLGGKIVEVRTALLTLNMMLDTVYPGIEESLYDVMSRGSETTSQGIKPLFQPNTEALTLMDQVTKKVKWLMELVGTKALQGRPQTVCTFTVPSASSKALVEDDADNIVSDMLDELEDMDDPTVKTRKDIKADSQRIVEIYDNPQRLFQDDKGPKYKKHKCF